MRPILALLIYIFVVFIGGALLAPWLDWLAQAFFPDMEKVAGAPFHRFVHRAILALALIGLWPLLRALGAKSAEDLGIVKPVGQWNKLFAGLAVGFCSLAVVAAIALAFGARRFPDTISAGKLFEKIGGAIGTAAAVSVLEEILFRGGIFAGLRRVMSWKSALILSSAIYAIVHFFAPARHSGAVVWDSGLALLPKMLAGFGDLHTLVPGFFNLTLAGALLAIAFQRTSNLYFSIGLHAGWIFWLKSYGAFTKQTETANVWLFGSSKLIDGWLACAVLVITLAILPQLKVLSPRKPE